jgi:hypothetical protein
LIIISPVGHFLNHVTVRLRARWMRGRMNISNMAMKAMSMPLVAPWSSCSAIPAGSNMQLAVPITVALLM